VAGKNVKEITVLGLNLIFVLIPLPRELRFTRAPLQATFLGWNGKSLLGKIDRDIHFLA